MGTRSDFYVGRGPNAEWIGSFECDGWPESFDRCGLFQATTPEAFRKAFLAECERSSDWILPEYGWPWPWNDSRLTDWAYAFDEGKVWCCNFGEKWETREEYQRRTDEEQKKWKEAGCPPLVITREDFQGPFPHNDPGKIDMFPNMAYLRRAR